jgi:hypothetical protein
LGSSHVATQSKTRKKMQNFQDQIKQELIKNSYENLTKGNAWEYFKKSNYYKYLQNEPAKFRTENTIRYAQKFLNDMQDLNLIEPECFNQ